MDLISKINELRAKEVTPEEFKEVWGVDEDEVAKRVMKAVNKAKKVKPKAHEARLRPAAEPYAPAAIDLDPVAAGILTFETKKMIVKANEISRRFAARPAKGKRALGKYSLGVLSQIKKAFSRGIVFIDTPRGKKRIVLGSESGRVAQALAELKSKQAKKKRNVAKNMIDDKALKKLRGRKGGSPVGGLK